MRFLRRRGENELRRPPRATAYRSTDLVKELRSALGPWLKAEGFKRLGGQAWVRPQGDHHLIAEVQTRQSGWDPRAGTSFIVELELAAEPRRWTGFARSRLWDLLDEAARREVLDLNDRVAATLPAPDRTFLAALPPGVREHYLARFETSTDDVDAGDVWLAYYDESDAAMWAEFLGRTLGPAVQGFLENPPVGKAF